jgi:cystathionine beta-synthase
LRVAERLTENDVLVVLLPDGGRGYLSKIFNDSWMGSYGFLSRDGDVTVGDVLRRKGGQLPSMVHTHPNETVRDAVEIMHEYGVSQMPVVSAEPPVMAGEVVGSVSERELLEDLFTGQASLADAVSKHMATAFPLVGSGENIPAVRAALEKSDAVMVVDDGKPAGVLTRADLLNFLAG